MFGQKRKTSPKEIASLIGIGSTVAGEVSFTGGLRIDGRVRGAVHCIDGDKGGLLVVSESGRVEGEVRAAYLVIAGQIEGPVHTSELVELQPKARIVGDLYYRAIEMHHGAVVEGRLIHLDEVAAATGRSTGTARPAPALAPTAVPKTDPTAGP